MSSSTFDRHKQAFSPELDSIIWDIYANDFHESSDFSKLLRKLQSGSLNDLIEDECSRVSYFLNEWEKQLIEFSKENRKIPCLTDLFKKTPELSGVLYYSHSTVLSEGLFDGSRDSEEHLTDRRPYRKIEENVPVISELTFSFPRQYLIEGFRNSWGFMRVPRKDADDGDSGVLLSVVTLDAVVLDWLKRCQCEQLVTFFNRSWNHAIHDYIHHVVLYTNPSFGIGKRSPLSLTNTNEKIDIWGDRIHSTFNYEYWAHSTHRLITQSILTDSQREAICDYAKEYAAEVFKFYHVLQSQSEQALSVCVYLLCIYLWPINVLFEPGSFWMNRLADSFNEYPLLEINNPINAVAELLIQSDYLEDSFNKKLFQSDKKLEAIIFTSKKSGSPEINGISGLLQAIGVDSWTYETAKLTWFDWIAIKTALVTRRGFYERWFHEEPVCYSGHPVHSHQATINFLDYLEETINVFDKKNNNKFILSGIVPD